MPRRALILVDIQQEYVDGPLAIQYPPVAESLANILAVIDTAEQAGIPVAAIRHVAPADSPVFAEGSAGQKLHPDVAARVTGEWKHATKAYASIFAGTDLTDWVRDNDIDTLTLVGYMSNNCILGTAFDAEPRGLAVEVLSDATGAITLSNQAGAAPARQVHETLMALLHSNLASVTTTVGWQRAVTSGTTLPGSNLIESATTDATNH